MKRASEFCISIYIYIWNGPPMQKRSIALEDSAITVYRCPIGAYRLLSTTGQLAVYH